MTKTERNQTNWLCLKRPLVALFEAPGDKHRFSVRAEHIEQISGIESLKEVHFDYLEVDIETIALLEKLPHLETVSLGRRFESEAEENELRQSLPCVEIIEYLPYELRN